MREGRILNKTLSFCCSSTGKINFWFFNCKERSKGKTDNLNKGQGDRGCLHSCSLVCFIQALFQAEYIYRRIKESRVFFPPLNQQYWEWKWPEYKSKKVLFYINFVEFFGADTGSSSHIHQAPHCRVLVLKHCHLFYFSRTGQSYHFGVFLSMLCNAREKIFSPIYI